MVRFCSECGEPLPDDASPLRKTCGTACRSKRSRRKARQRRAQNQLPPELAELSKRSSGEIKDLGAKAIREQVGPVVREALDKETLDALRDMVGLSAAAIEVLRKDLESENTRLRQKAAELILRYTVGNDALKPKEEDSGKQIQINFALPRPEHPETAPQPEVELDEPTIDTRQCDMCQEYRTADEFVEGSDRCVPCFEEQQALAERLLT